MSLSRATTAALVAALCLPTAIASADVIAPAPERCAEGSTPVDFCHGPSTCQISGCTNDSECGAGLICEQRALCTREHCCSGRCCGGGCGTPPTTYVHVEGPCDSSGACADFGTTCSELKVCVPGTRPDGGGGGTDGGAIDDGGADADAGGTGIDAGGTGIDAGGTGIDAGGTGAMDSGPEPDAGAGGPTDGGCCSVTGPRSAVGGGLFLALFALTIARLRRRR